MVRTTGYLACVFKGDYTNITLLPNLLRELSIFPISVSGQNELPLGLWIPMMTDQVHLLFLKRSHFKSFSIGFCLLTSKCIVTIMALFNGI